jgi:hypothetical protein
MTPLQPVTGFFEHAAEAQQAVQVLLSSGFAREVLSLSTQTPLTQSPLQAATDLSPLDSIDRGPGPDETTSGHFLFSLFGSVEGTKLHQPDSTVNDPAISAGGRIIHNGATVRVQIQSIAEAKQAHELLLNAGATTDHDCN